MSSAPTKYTRQANFTAFSTAHPDEQQPGSSLDAEFDTLVTVANKVIDRLNEIQRNDGALANQVVTPDTLAATTLALISAVGISPKGAWLTGTAYAVSDIVTQSGGCYICVTAHTSGVFATDAAAAKWMILSNPVANQSLSTTDSPSFVNITGTGNASFGGTLNVTGDASFGGATNYFGTRLAVGINSFVGAEKFRCNGASYFDAAITAQGGVADGGSAAGFTSSGFGNTTNYSIQGFTSSTYCYAQAGGSGGVILNSGATSWAVLSDETMKTGLEPITDAVSKVATLRAVTGRYITDPDDKVRTMLIAQDVEKVVPGSVTTQPRDPKDMPEDKRNPWAGKKSLEYDAVIPLLVAAINELSADNATLKARLAALEAKP